jgi:glycosyltransferase involved in cell wall biosynthesis
LFTLLSDVDCQGDLEALGDLCECVKSVRLPLSRADRRSRVLHSTMRRRAFQLDYFFSREGAELVDDWVRREHFDVIVPCQLYMWPYVPEDRRSIVVFDSVNVEVRRLGALIKSGWNLSAVIARLQLAPTRELEREVVRTVERVLAVSDIEADAFREFGAARVEVVANGVDASVGARAAQPVGAEVLFVGSLNYSANIDAVHRLIEKIAPRLKSPNVSITVVGADPPAEVHRLAASAAVPVEVTGFVDSTASYFARARVLAVPLRFGAGTRLKILEALAAGLPVVTTTLGCEGLGIRNGVEALVEDDPARFAAAIDKLVSDTALCEALASAGRELVDERYDWGRIGKRLDEQLRSAAARFETPSRMP